jgi:hypothetical protein
MTTAKSKQVPHRAFSPIRNDISIRSVISSLRLKPGRFLGTLYAALEAPLFHVTAGFRGPTEFRLRIRVNSNGKGAGRSVRPTWADLAQAETKIPMSSRIKCNTVQRCCDGKKKV